MQLLECLFDVSETHGFTLRRYLRALEYVGESRADEEREAFRWDASNGMAGLGVLPSGASTALAVSFDGAVIVGSDGMGGTGTAFIWDEQNGIRPLAEVLALLGLDVAGWTLYEATGISADGRTIVGSGVNPDGFQEAWIATIPEPTTGLLMAFALACVALGSRADRIP